jgi:hypothetical protein
MSGWLDVKLLNSGLWNTTLPVVKLDAAIVSLKLKEYVSGDDIVIINEKGEEVKGFSWPEMYSNASAVHSEMVVRDALSVVAAFISHCDNFDGNQGFMCLDEYGSDTAAGKRAGEGKDKTECKGQPFLFIHDVGGTFGYGWSLQHLDFWPNYMDLQQWLELSVWKSTERCEVQVMALPGGTMRNQKVSQEGLALAASMLGQFTNTQIVDLFTSARANLMRNDTIADWIDGFKAKLKRDILGPACGRN